MTPGGVDREWLEFVAHLMSTRLVELPVEPIAHQLNRTFRGVGCAFSTPRTTGSLDGGLFAPDTQLDGLKAEFGLRQEGSVAPLQRVRRVHPIVRLHPIRLHYRATGCAPLLQVSDVPSRFVDHAIRGAWLEATAAWRCSEQIVFPLASGGDRAFALARDQRFHPQEMEAAGRIWRLLIGLDRQVQALACSRTCSAAAQVVRLTPRELAVLGQLAAGLTAVSIARRLSMSPRTVHKHLEHVYAKLGVTDRLSAVLRARDAGILPGHGDAQGARSRPDPSEKTRRDAVDENGRGHVARAPSEA
jgi:DNA-binding CsgD family transcriptional regulator